MNTDSQWARIFKKVLAKKTREMKSNKSISRKKNSEYSMKIR